MTDRVDPGFDRATLKPFSRIDHYRIIRPLGQGGRGVVYLARDTKLGRRVALKVINPSALGDEKTVDKFLVEAKVTARFNHPHIVTVYGVGEYRNSPYVALEYLEGETLKQRIANERPGVKESIRIGLAIADALKEAHKHNILHRDLKPENVMLPRDGRLRVVDFGLATALIGLDSAPIFTNFPAPPIQSRSPGRGALDLDLTMTNAHNEAFGFSGTPRYMAPERWKEETPTDVTDIWSLGAILYELLSGRHPYPNENIHALFQEVCSDSPVPEPIYPDKVSGDLAALITRCLSKRPADRPTAAEVTESLHGMLRETLQPQETESNPFRGLLPFNESQADLFFGREAEVDAFIEQLREKSTSAVVGPTGAGKSSFIQAGVIPRLREQGRWTVISLRPGRNASVSLADALREAEVSGSSSGGPKPDSLIPRLNNSPGLLTMALLSLAETKQSRVLLFVDQLEEIFTLDDDEETRKTFIRTISSVADDPKGSVRVIFTLRDDFLVQLADTAEGRQMLGNITVLHSPGPEALRDILVEPLRYTGYRYEDEELTTEIAQSVQGELACLPLVQFICNRLWEHRDHKQRIISRSAYIELGGVEGALARHADRLLQKMLPEQVDLVRQILLRLVTIENTRHILTMDALLEGLSPEAGKVLDTLAEERIVTKRKARGPDEPSVELELVHESLIRDWKQLKQWVDESRDEMVFLDEVTAAAEIWVKRGCRAEEVWSGTALQETLIKADRCLTIPKTVRRFLAAGKERGDARTRQKRLFTLALMLVLAVIVLWFSGREQAAMRARNEMMEQLRQTEKRLGDTEIRLRNTEAKLRTLEQHKQLEP